MTLDGPRRWSNVAGELWKCCEKIVSFRNILPERLKISIEVEEFWNWRNDMATGHEGKESPRYCFRYHTNNQKYSNILNMCWNVEEKKLQMIFFIYLYIVHPPISDAIWRARILISDNKWRTLLKSSRKFSKEGVIKSQNNIAIRRRLMTSFRNL